MRHLLDKYIPIKIALETILGSLGNIACYAIFGNAPLAAAEGRRVRY